MVTVWDAAAKGDLLGLQRALAAGGGMVGQESESWGDVSSRRQRYLWEPAGVCVCVCDTHHSPQIFEVSVRILPPMAGMPPRPVCMYVCV